MNAISFTLGILKSKHKMNSLKVPFVLLESHRPLQDRLLSPVEGSLSLISSKIQEIQHVPIPMRDGKTMLSARLWIKKGASEVQRVPAILEYIPYGKRMGTQYTDEDMHPWLAAHGYACLRVDLRGFGESGGQLLEDEYSEQEMQDGEDVLGWISRQEWCSGKIGIIGKSWGGFNGLQLAQRGLPSLTSVWTGNGGFF